ncbi:bifunctional phosphopantothenoylcysteine decarboxylase/phosphopantothenate--cysteine ligase CoaBC [Agrilactobacillus yilanensis]|nr:bifunctional phosphopantothenoylcysteine decarboxylase/phosphopantothenate--cysteine ligase CoaBC [Agrilactobacillus yilanensis]
MFENRNIVIFISGGIAAYKIPMLMRRFQKDGANVRVVLTEHAKEFVTPLVFESLIHEHTYTQMFNDDLNPSPVHIKLADWADMAIIAPATANIVGKMANGIADDLVTSTLIAMDCPKYLVPAMNSKMLHNPATQRNLTQLASDGVAILTPAYGLLAEGYAGDGRMPEPDEIFDKITLLESCRLSESNLKNKNVVITAGGTREAIDPVRYIGNNSSGKMGYALAQAAAYAGAHVTLISANSHQPKPNGVKLVPVTTAKEMQTAVEAEFAKTDVVIMAAAVADYRPEETFDHKIKKDSAESLEKITLVKNPDILATLGQQKQNQFLVGFAAETTELEAFAQTKLKAKNADMVIANDVSQAGIGFNSDENAVVVISADEAKVVLPKAPKTVLAQKLIELIATRI